MESLTIESPQNSRIKAIARLREKRGRNQAGYFLIDGARECQRAFLGKQPIVTLLVCRELLTDGVGAEFDYERWAKQLTVDQVADTEVPWENQCPVWELGRAAFEKVCYGQRVDGVIAVARSQDHPLQSLPLGQCPLLVVVEGLEKPGNLGAIFRTADAVGVDGLILADAQVDADNANVIRASLGTRFHVPLAEATSIEVRQWLEHHHIQIVAARLDTASVYHQVDYRVPTALVFGSEAYGLSHIWSGPTVQPVAIPMKGIADSLNVSVSAAVLLYEAMRQRMEG